MIGPVGLRFTAIGLGAKNHVMYKQQPAAWGHGTHKSTLSCRIRRAPKCRVLRRDQVVAAFA